ncbi:MAG TPA: rhomboid family intramembrane serine protease [Vicinamibacterales bacterium]|nr:rhomboid family intramembrane serine protease [Vicinamibacterales bacterium]
MSRYAPSGMSYSFGPGAMTPAVRAILFANLGAFVATLLLPGLMIDLFGLRPQAFLERGRLWQIVTYLFLHDPQSVMHILFNMLALWMFGVDLERRWGTQAFTRYYFLTGIGAGVSTVLISLLPLDSVRPLYGVPTIGASGAIYGLLMAWAILFPHRTILFMMLFPLPARVFVLIMGTLAFLSAVSVSGGVVNEFAHLGGMLAGWLYLKGPTNFRLDMKYRLTKWRMDRMRRRFDVHRGGRSNDDWNKRVH